MQEIVAVFCIVISIHHLTEESQDRSILKSSGCKRDRRNANVFLALSILPHTQRTVALDILEKETLFRAAA